MAEENQDGNDSKVLDNSDQPKDKQPSNDDIEKFRNIQSVADRTQAENERLKKELEEVKGKTSEVEQLKTEMAEIKKEKEVALLETTYPDIEPELLFGKTAEDQAKIVEKQRARTKEFSANAIDVNTPQYTQTEFETQKENIKKSTKTPIEKAMEIQKLQRLQNGE